MSIETITHADLQAMIGRDVEGERLEFKVDIPVHRQSQREQAAQGIRPPRDAWWTGKQLADYGRDKLLEEVVAFANAQGGVLLLGIDEDPSTTLATAIIPLPRIADLEVRFRDYLLSCIEPRLPQMALRAIETDGKGGGVLAVEVQPSRLGPHRVTGTLQIPIRRADKCMAMTMPEVNAMVLRNARRFDEVRSTLDRRAEEVEIGFYQFLRRGIDIKVSGGSEDSHIDIWLQQKKLSAYGIRVTICAHDDLGIVRIGTLDHLIPDKRCVAEQTNQGPVTHLEMVGLWPESGYSERFLGGVRCVSALQDVFLETRALREGMVEQTFFTVLPSDRHIQTPFELAGCLGCCMGMYNRLRASAGRPDVPAEASVLVLARGPVTVANSIQLASVIDRQLPARSYFPRRTIADAADCTQLLNLTTQDFLDAANVRGHSPTFIFLDT